MRRIEPAAATTEGCLCPIVNLKTGPMFGARLRRRMTMITNAILTQGELKDEDLNVVTGGDHFSGGWVPGGNHFSGGWAPLTLATPPMVDVSGVQPIHLPPLPALHTAVPHF